MNEIFGFQLVAVMIVLAAALGGSLLAVGWIAWRRPVVFKLGVRNIPRRKAQTTLIVLGLMLSTLIFSAALGTGDTLTYSLTKDVYDAYGNVDALVVESQQVDAPYLERATTFDESALGLVEGGLDGNPAADGIMPLLAERVPMQDLTSGLSEPTVVLVGIDPTRIGGFGGLRGADGSYIELGAMAAHEVVLSEKAAEALDAEVGDIVAVTFGDEPSELVVAGIAEDTYLSGYRRGREDYLELSGAVMSLTALQDLTGQPGRLSAIALSGAGSVREGFRQSDAMKEALRATLEGSGLGVDTAKAQAVKDGDRIAGAFTSIFLILSLFSVISGVLLIVLIFTMLAAERRSEMGMARAVGTQRKQLIQQFIAEGAGYAVLSGMVGSLLGVGATFGIAKGMKLLFGQYAPIEAHVEPRSLAIAYCLGVLVTLLTVAISSWHISHLNVVSAIRDLPESRHGKRRLRSLVFGVFWLGVGALGAVAGLGSSSAVLFLTGASVAPFGLALILRWFRLPGRVIFSLLGIGILAVWLLPERVGAQIWGELDRGTELFFVSGIFMVIGATLLIMQNTDLLLGLVGKAGSLSSSTLPAVRAAIAYPSAAKGRTGLTIAMFSLIVFSLVMMATMSSNYNALYGSDNANGGWDVRADMTHANAVASFSDGLGTNGVDTTTIRAVGMTTSPNPASSEVRIAGTDDWKRWPVRGMDDPFLTHTTFTFSQRAIGYETDAEIVAALRNDADLAVVDSNAVSQGGIGTDESAFALTGVSASDTAFAPIAVELAGPDGTTHRVQVIGVIDQALGSLEGLYMHQRTIDATYPSLASVSYFVALEQGTDAAALAKAIESTLISHGAEAISIWDELRDAQKEDTGFLYLIEGFMGLGLVVGIAAVGVIAFRSVVERRQQIGVLRALGFQRSLVSLSFLIETAFVVGLGVVAGTLLGVVLGYNLFASDAGGGAQARFSVPFGMIALILASTLAMALLMTWVPARQAAKIAPAEALRYE
jgi:putative ABC transport system permease protein